MTAVAQTCYDVRESYRSPLVGLERRYADANAVSIMRRHCKLGVEHGRADTSPEPRWQIREEIQSLRALRDDLIAEWIEDVKKWIKIGTAKC
ncbi:hypothetical protein ACFOQM_00060 [Paenibacillus sp. GCM10012307]|uniref:Uncharacterized protein n=1 Tax=Paenibacillus roseus TaxID=2798579 RepID=A0A934MNS9_9BACL|nr:hypothetical protein [Paenibacillus roseus]MBJ6359724.1 hypothetical protein [Paenibacillus roseus]